jgi:hypothetical protein
MCKPCFSLREEKELQQNSFRRNPKVQRIGTKKETTRSTNQKKLKKKRKPYTTTTPNKN